MSITYDSTHRSLNPTLKQGDSVESAEVAPSIGIELARRLSA